MSEKTIIPEYNFKKQEEKWQKKWEAEKLYQPDLDKAQKPFYNLMMFPYPSAEGLHIGGVYTFTGVDTFGRLKKMQGYDVFEPIGLDGFGIHSENYAMKIGEHIKEVSGRTEKNFYRQLSSIGNMYDWSRTVETYKPEYYKWTQWLFLKLFEKGLAYQKEAKVNWCPWCKTVLSDEQVIQGLCERCDSQVEKKELKQWFFKITDYAERLLKNLEWIDWSEDVKTNQKNWIGKSEGAKVKFSISNNQSLTSKEDVLILHGWEGSSQTDWIPETKKYLESLGHKVYAFDAPNTEKPVFEEWLEFIEDKIEKNKLKEFILIGHSMGGLLAGKLAEKYSLNQLVLVAPVGPKGSEGYLQQFGEKITPEELEVFRKYQNRELDVQKIKKNAKKMQIIFGEKDPWIPKEIREFYINNFPEAKIQILEGQGHISGDEGVKKCKELENLFNLEIEVFTTRPDTLFGATYMVLAPEHELIENLKDQIENWEEVEKYITQAKNKSEQERKEEEKDKTGVEVKGIKAINPVNNEEIPIWIADYVLAGYGTGAIMAVPAHDERDWEFAKKYGIEIKTVVAPYLLDKKFPPKPDKNTKERDVVAAIVKNPKTNEYLCLEWTKTTWQSFITGGIDGEKIQEAARREVWEESGYKNLKFIKEIKGGPIFAEFYRLHKGDNVIAKFRYLVFELENEERDEIDSEELKKHKPVWIKEEEIENFINVGNQKIAWYRYKNGDKAYTELGQAINSDFLDGLKTEEAKAKMIEWLEEKGLGKKSIDYKLRDWCVSRQRYWGPPIPIIHCKKCGAVPVPEKDLPVELPDMEDFLPEGKGRGPLAKNKEFVNVKCPTCGGDAERETDVSDPFVDSAWYFLRYPSTEFDTETINKERAKKWLPVDSYIGGKEHTVLHLLYSRFITMVLNDLGYIEFEEPYKRFFGHGLITKDGAKMSKSKGNVINPDEMLEKYGADAVRLYLRFLGDFSQGGDWRDDGAEGMSRFVKKTWSLFFELNGNGNGVEKTHMIDRTIKVIGEDIDKLSFNTAVARYMEFINWIKDNSNNFNQEQLERVKEVMALVIAPMAPFMAEEFWASLGNKKSIFVEKWPEYDENNLEDDSFELVVQINGKVRDKIMLSRGISEEEAKKKALHSEKISKNLDGQEPKKVIYIKEKLINIVI